MVGNKIMKFFVFAFYLILVIVHTHECFEAGRKFFGCDDVVKIEVFNPKNERSATMETNQTPVLSTVQPQTNTKNSLTRL